MEATKTRVGVPASTEDTVKLHHGVPTISPIGYPEVSAPQAAKGLTWVQSHSAEGIVPATPTAHYPVLPSMLVRRPLQNVKVALENADLWRKFHRIGTEMIITKTGRRMFPPLQISVSGLNPVSDYYFLLELTPVTSEIPSRSRDAGVDCTGSPRPSLVHRLRFSGREWVVAARGEAQAPTSSRIYVHPDSPAPGSRWMKGFGRRNGPHEPSQAEYEADDEQQKEQKKYSKRKHIISFSKVKLTNNSLDGRGHVVLTSMHKYIPRIHVVKASDYMSLSWGAEAVFSFPETEFVAVTAYQNGKITKLKIDHNPFAKGFRETGMSKSKRKLEQVVSKDSDEGNSTDEEELSKIPCLDCNNNGGSANLRRLRANSAQSTSIESGPSRSPNTSPEGSSADSSLALDDSMDKHTHSNVAHESLQGYFPFLWASFAQQSGLQMANYDHHYFPHHMLPRYPEGQFSNLARRGIFPYQHPSFLVPSLWKMPLLYPTTPSFDCLTAHTASTTSFLPHSQIHFPPPLPYMASKLAAPQEKAPYLLDLSSKHS